MNFDFTNLKINFLRMNPFHLLQNGFPICAIHSPVYANRFPTSAIPFPDYANGFPTCVNHFPTYEMSIL